MGQAERWVRAGSQFPERSHEERPESHHHRPELLSGQRELPQSGKKKKMVGGIYRSAT